MTGLIGAYRHAIDDKGRLTLPARIRDALGSAFVVTKGLDNCLFMYPAPEWEALDAKLRALPLTNREARQFVRVFYAGASECRCDAQGRVLLPAVLREYAGLEREGVVVGVSTRVEVWKPEAWAGYVQEGDAGYEDLADRMEGLGL